MAAVTDEEKVQIATSFLLSSPPGEYNEVVTDVRALIGNDNLLNRHFGTVCKEYNTDQYEIVTASDGHKVLLTKFGEIAANKYAHPRGNAVVTVDHVQKTVTSSESKPGSGKYESYRASIDTAMEEYVNDHFPEGATTVYASDKGVIICISSAKFSPGNFWNGRWRSTWEVTFNPGAANATYTGTYKLSVHYYEDGNVQLNTESTVSFEAPLGDAAGAGENVKKAIARAENEYQLGIEECYKIMGERSFKNLRRKLPVTRHPMDWDKAVGYKLGKDLSQA